MPETRYLSGPRGALAYQVLGRAGDIDVVWVPGLISHLDVQWQLPAYRTFMRKLARHCRLVRYDKLGTGLSDPTTSIPTPDERVVDLHAVIEASEARTPVVLGFSESGPLAISYALRYPTRGLILYGTSMRSPTPPHLAVLEGLLDHWGRGDSLDVFAPSTSDDPAARSLAGAFERASASPSMIRHVMGATTLVDAKSALARVTVPTIVVHRDREFIPLGEAEALAEGIPGAELVVLPGIDHHPWAGDQDVLIDTFARFLQQLSPHRPGPPVTAGAPRRRSGPMSLTPAEQRVAERAAAGMSNPDIARDLYLARTTVETHLKRVYAKLGVDGRHQLPGQLSNER